MVHFELNAFHWFSSFLLLSSDPTVYNETTHDISLVGWGEEGGISYWIGRNSFGTLWVCVVLSVHLEF